MRRVTESLLRSRLERLSRNHELTMVLRRQGEGKGQYRFENPSGSQTFAQGLTASEADAFIDGAEACVLWKRLLP